MYYMYVVRCADSTLYTGITTGVTARIHAHNTSLRGAKYTRSRRPVTLLYTKEYRTKSAALKAEYAFKHLSRKEKIKAIDMANQKKDPDMIAFRTPKVFLTWLKKNYSREEGIWLRFFKKDSGVKSITYAEALDEALCYGWIDGQVKKYDADSWIQKFTPRRMKSLWSQKNREHVARLVREKRMMPPGLAVVEAAKADGRWDNAYASPSAAAVPEYFLNTLKKNAKARAFFETLNKTNRYAIIWRLETAKKEETRVRRMVKIIRMLEDGRKFH